MSLHTQIASASDMVNTISTRVATPLLVLFGMIILGKLVRNLLYKFLTSVEFDTRARKALKYRAEYTELVAGGLAVIIYTVGVIWALVIAGIIQQALWAVVGFLGIFGILGLLLAVRDFLPDLLARPAVRRKVKKGSTLSVQGVTGTVQKIGLMEVRIKGKDKLLYVIPHRTVRRTF